MSKSKAKPVVEVKPTKGPIGNTVSAQTLSLKLGLIRANRVQGK